MNKDWTLTEAAEQVLRVEEAFNLWKKIREEAAAQAYLFSLLSTRHPVEKRQFGAHATLVESMLARAFLCLLLAGPLLAQPAAVFTQVEEMLAALTRITGWQVKRRVPSDILPREKFVRMVEQAVQEAQRDKDVRAAEITLKMFGLAPWDFNLARESGDLVAEQAAAFYDFRKKRLFILDSTQDRDEQRIALVHELAHALADQQYSLRKYMEAAATDDATLARQSVVEGQAMWLSWAYVSYTATGRAEVPRAMVDELAETVAGKDDEFPVFARVPPYLRESLVFPYTEGMRFQDAVYRRSGTASFDLLFREPPRSTHEILHAGRYRAGPAPAQPQLPRLEEAVGRGAVRQFRKLVEGDVGEFDYSALLRQYGEEGPAREAVSHWRGGAYALYEHKRKKYPLLMHASEWDSPEAAATFYRLYLQVLQRKWRRMEVASSSPAETRGAGDTGEFVIRLRDASVQAIEGIH
jgi:hypothetical protein